MLFKSAIPLERELCLKPRYYLLRLPLSAEFWNWDIMRIRRQQSLWRILWSQGILSRRWEWHIFSIQTSIVLGLFTYEVSVSIIININIIVIFNITMTAINISVLVIYILVLRKKLVSAFKSQMDISIVFEWLENFQSFYLSLVKKILSRMHKWKKWELYDNSIKSY